MALTDTNREASGGARRLAVRDLRFAGTVAAGLVAGVLGVGALSAPLLGWTKWPASGQPGDGDAPALRLAEGQASTPDRRPAQRSVGGGNAADSVVTILGSDGTPIVIADGGATTGATGTPGTSVTVSLPGTPGPSGEPQGPREPGRVVGTGSPGTPSGGDVGSSGPLQTTGDIDRDGMRDEWELANGLDPQSAGDQNLDNDGDGLTNREEFMTRTSPLNPDGYLDSDRDGVRNAVEIRAGSYPWTPDSNGDGVWDGALDPDGDGITTIDEQNAGTDPATPESGNETPVDTDPSRHPARVRRRPTARARSLPSRTRSRSRSLRTTTTTMGPPRPRLP